MFFTGRGRFCFRSSNWMTIPLSLAALLFLSCACVADCLSKEDAGKHIGASKCVRGTVLHVKDGGRGATFLDFCDDYRSCPFTVVVFSRDLKRVGDVRYLQGKQIEIHGKIQEYDGRAEIILSRYQQLRGEAARIPPLPRDYDVEKRGKYSAGTFSHPNSGKPSRKRNKSSVSIEDMGGGTAPEQ
jgi:DNA/RNA endonuclease YhcR with UshA esterase domain